MNAIAALVPCSAHRIAIADKAESRSLQTQITFISRVQFMLEVPDPIATPCLAGVLAFVQVTKCVTAVVTGGMYLLL